MKTLSSALLGLTLLAAPQASSAATVTLDAQHRQGTTFGTARFSAAPGEANRLAIERTVRGVVFRDSANPVRARGDCERLDAHAARCPSTEDPPRVRLLDGDDSARVADVTIVDGGAGDDVLRAVRAPVALLGGRGDDGLTGGRGDDSLTAGPGRDRVFGGAGDDDLVDGETDAHPAHDVFRGGDSRDTSGADHGDTIDYERRHDDLRIDLGRRRSNTGDTILGLESVEGGSGDDRLTGDGDDNFLYGGGGADVLRGRDGRDILFGGRGDDRAHGGADGDVLWGDGGRDRLYGDAGDDLLEARDRGTAERVSCGAGDDDAVNDRADTLAPSCERSAYQTFSRTVNVAVQPAIGPDRATFRVACYEDGPGSCDGTISLAGLDGTPFGSGDFAGLPDDPRTFTDVLVTLTPAGAAALRDGATVQVAYGRSGGYRAFMRAG